MKLSTFEDSCRLFFDWLLDSERTMNSYVFVASLRDKQDQLHQFKVPELNFIILILDHCSMAASLVDFFVM